MYIFKAETNRILQDVKLNMGPLGQRASERRSVDPKPHFASAGNCLRRTQGSRSTASKLPIGCIAIATQRIKNSVDEWNPSFFVSIVTL